MIKNKILAILKKYFILLLLILFFQNLSYGFEILDLEENRIKFISNKNDEILIKEDKEIKNFFIEYKINGVLKTKVFDYEEDSKNSFYRLSLLEIYIDNKDFLQIPKKIDVVSNLKRKQVLIDITYPEVKISNFEIDKKNKKLNFVFSYSDDSKIKSSKLSYIYNKENKEIKLNSPKQKVEIPLYKSGEIEILAKVEDEAQNEKNLLKKVTIEDIFNPELLNYFLEVDEKTRLNVKAKDDDEIQKIEIFNGKNNKLIKRNLVKNTDNVDINFFDIINLDGYILKIYDKSNNIFEKKVVLNKFNFEEKKIITTNLKKIEIKDKRIKSCFLEKLNNNDVSKDFFKKNDMLLIDVNFLENQENEVEFYCITDNLKKHFKKKYFFDNKIDKNLKFGIEKTNLGFPKINIEKIEDISKPVTYQILRDDKVIFQSINLEEYYDGNLENGKNYSYKIKYFDSLNNYHISQNIIFNFEKKKDVEKINNLNEKINLIENSNILNDTKNILDFKNSSQNQIQTLKEILNYIENNKVDENNLTSNLEIQKIIKKNNTFFDWIFVLKIIIFIILSLITFFLIALIYVNLDLMKNYFKKNKNKKIKKIFKNSENSLTSKIPTNKKIKSESNQKREEKTLQKEKRKVNFNFLNEKKINKKYYRKQDVDFSKKKLFEEKEVSKFENFKNKYLKSYNIKKDLNNYIEKIEDKRKE